MIHACSGPAHTVLVRLSTAGAPPIEGGADAGPGGLADALAQAGVELLAARDLCSATPLFALRCAEGRHFDEWLALVSSVVGTGKVCTATVIPIDDAPPYDAVVECISSLMLEGDDRRRVNAFLALQPDAYAPERAIASYLRDLTSKLQVRFSDRASSWELMLPLFVRAACYLEQWDM